MAKIFESPDRGKTVYQREAGELTRELVSQPEQSIEPAFSIPEGFIKQYPNDNDLGAAVRKAYWQRKQA